MVSNMWPVGHMQPFLKIFWYFVIKYDIFR